MVSAQSSSQGARRTRAAALCASTIFVSAFLLFLVQPLIARQILPWFGGSAAVWTLCLVFFQVVLLLGYLYADRLSRWPLRIQGRVHAVLLLGACATLPIVPSAMWKPATGDADPSLGVLAVLVATIGLPYLAVCTTGPLVQSWVARLHAGDGMRQARVYRLFALSNLAALVALVVYPFVLEPAFAMHAQALAWSAAFAFFALLAIASAWTVARALRDRPPEVDAASSSTLALPPSASSPRLSEMLLWLALSALDTVSLLSVSTYITQDVASVPLLWIVPLALYLLTFVLCFDSGFWYRRWLFWPLVLVVAPALAWYLNTPFRNLPIATVIAMFCAGLFVICMFCNGELARARPAPAHLTRFYLAMALGGALGGLFAGIAAPMLFDDYWELPGSLAIPGLLLFWLARGRKSSRPAAWISAATRILGVIAALAVVTMMVESRRDANTNTLLRARNFYGVLKVNAHDLDDSAKASRRLVNGVIAHGEQLLADDLRRIPTAYYGPLSGIGLALTTHRPPVQRIGVIGLGVGTLAAYGRSLDTLRFYEINPQVTRIAHDHFTYLGDSAARIEIVPGDARLVMQQELDTGRAQAFDVLLVDAFTGDAIPMHLMTREALAVYAGHLKPGGVIAFHVSNRHIDLVPVVKRLADDAGFGALRVAYDPPANNTLEHPSDYVLVSPDPAFADNADLAALGAIPLDAGDAPLWTDQHGNLLAALRPRSP
ncbi:fused MFS/spermidine synthase [Variovorax sp. RHLX14]|uniref:fused MFS/spermidine synthase n=1 Tax=Variovorax sp. RHLX14 TaxID=1259731 RepID=UPI003F4467FB